MENILNSFKEYSIQITIAVSMFVALLKLWQYIDIRRKESRQRRFENYHKLIERIASPIGKDTHTRLDIQRAAIFELRHYPEYKAVTKDVLPYYETIHKDGVDTGKDSELKSIIADTLNQL